MRRRIGWLVAATTSAVILAFVIPLCLLVRTMAEDRALAHADEEARNVAVLVSGLRTDPRLGELVAAVDARSPARTTVLLADGRTLGSRPADRAALARDPEVARARAGQAFTIREGSGAEILVPVVTEAGTEVVHTTVTGAELHRGVGRAWLAIGALGLVLLVVALLLADRIGRRISTPVAALAGVAHRLREGELDARAEPSGPPETVELGRALNRLAERVGELLAAERAAVGDLSHRLRTPVTALRLDAEAVQQPDVAERLGEHVAVLQRAIDAIVKDARRPVTSAMGASCDATAVVRERAAFWSALAEDQDREVTLSLPSRPVRAPLSAEDLRDLVDVLVDNVFAHTPDGTGFTVALTGGERVSLVVEDQGPGAPYAPADRPGTTGLGLQIVRRTVAAAGGSVTVQHGPDGTRVEVLLPHGQSSPAPS
ncbi:MAG: ATP-binding protein [Nocardioides sp.]